MTLDFDALDRALIDALKHDATASRAPRAARARVALRLASAGAVGLGVSAAGVSATATTPSAAASGSAASGIATSAAASGVGTSSAASAGASMSFGVLVKTLAVGMAFGASVGFGLHVAFNGSPFAPRDETTARAPAGPLSTRAVERTAAPAAELPELGRAEHSAGAARAAIVSESPAPQVASVGVRAKRVLDSGRSVHARPSRSAETSNVNPGPELPNAPAAASATQSLAEQQKLLDAARAALARGDANAALASIRAHIVTFQSTAFEEERELLWIKALLALGRTSEARWRAQTFHARFPRSALVSSLESALTAASTSEPQK